MACLPAVNEVTHTREVESFFSFVIFVSHNNLYMTLSKSVVSYTISCCLQKWWLILFVNWEGNKNLMSVYISCLLVCLPSSGIGNALQYFMRQNSHVLVRPSVHLVPYSLQRQPVKMLGEKNVRNAWSIYSDSFPWSGSLISGLGTSLVKGCV